MATSPERPLSSVPKVAFVERLDCTQIHAVFKARIMITFLVKLRNLYSKSLAAEPSKNLLMNYLLVTLFTHNEGCTFVTETGLNWFLLH